MNVVISLLAFVGAVYLLLMVVMFVVQRQLIYHPVQNLGLPGSYGFVKAKHVQIQTVDGETITAWYAPPTTRKETIVYLHGNRGNIGNRTHKLIGFTKAGYGILALSWRGFGNSSGKPSEKGLLNDARAAIAWLQIPYESIIIYGESLGSGIAVQIATEFPAKLLMLEAPYVSMINMAQKSYPWLPVKWILRDRFHSIMHIEKIQSPLLIIHGESDDLIPAEHSKILFQAAPEPKRLVLYPHVHHTDFSMQQILQPLAEMENHIRH